MTSNVIEFSLPKEEYDWKVSCNIEMDLVLNNKPKEITEEEMHKEIKHIAELIEDYLRGYKLSMKAGRYTADRINK